MASSADVDRPAGMAELATRGPLASILWGTSLVSREVTYWLAGAGDWLNGFTTEAWTAYERDRLEAALAGLSSVAAVSFTEVATRDEADFVIGLDTDEMEPTDLGFFFPPETQGAGLGLFNAAAWDRLAGGDLEAGGVGFATLTHELLHGLGLSHPHDDGGTSSIMAAVEVAYDDSGAFGLNQGVFTTMSYNPGVIDAELGAPTSLSGSWGVEIGPMALDIAAIQFLYGANMITFDAGDAIALDGLTMAELADVTIEIDNGLG